MEIIQQYYFRINGVIVAICNDNILGKWITNYELHGIECTILVMFYRTEKIK